MIFKCQGVSPNAWFGCTRALGHDDRGQACKNKSANVSWCSICDEWDCDHVPPVDVAETAIILRAREDSRKRG